MRDAVAFSGRVHSLRVVLVAASGQIRVCLAARNHPPGHPDRSPDAGYWNTPERPGNDDCKVAVWVH